MKGLSGTEMEIISHLEFDKTYFFTSEYIDRFTKDKTQRYNIIKSLIKKKRIVKLNKKKYFLIPIKAKSNSWSIHPFILIDEIMEGTNYLIGGWSAANHYNLTENIPMQFDVYTTRREGKINIMNTKIFFHRTTTKRAKRGVTETVEGHNFRIIPKEEATEWMKSKK